VSIGHCDRDVELPTGVALRSDEELVLGSTDSTRTIPTSFSDGKNLPRNGELRNGPGKREI